MKTQRKRVFLVEDIASERGRIAACIESQNDLTLAGSAPTLAEALAWLRQGEPDVMLCDLGLPDGSGVTVIRECVDRYPSCLVMVVTVFADDQHAFESLEAGALGYLLKESTGAEIADQIRALIAGGSPISPPIARRVLSRLGGGRAGANQHGDADAAGHLSPREIKVLQYLAKGFSNQEVAKFLELTPNTIATYVRRIYRKLTVHSRGEAVFEAHQLGYLELPRR
jgi:DNA-binding NarL/FixJ family response regulator